MKIYNLVEPQDYTYARAGRRGTWYPDPGPGVCPECGVSRQERVSPLVIEWLPDSDRIGDFVWPGFNDEIVITERVKEALEANFTGFRCGPVEMIQSASLKRPMRITKRTRPRVWLPYEGPPLFDLQATSCCNLDRERSKVQLNNVCPTCGTEFYLTPSFKEGSLIIDTKSWDKSDFFQIYEYKALSFCTQLAKDYIEAQKFTNVAFLVRGEIPVD